MALNFPGSPTNGQGYQGFVYNSAVGAWQSNPASVAPFYTADIPPTNPTKGDSWFNTNDGTMYIYTYDGNTYQWVEHRSEIARSQVGLVPVKPTSVSVASGTASVDVNGLVTFTGAGNVMLNGVFTSAYSNYKIIFATSTVTVSTATYFRFAQAGTATSSSIWYGAGYYYGINGAGVLTATNAGAEIYVNSVVSTGFTNLATSADITINKNNFISQSVGFPNNAGGAISYGLWNASVSSYDGFRINPASGNMTGTVKVYGWN